MKTVTIDNLEISIRNDLDKNVINDVYKVNDWFKYITKPKTIIDIGGHIGTFGVKVKSFWPNSLLFAFEPNKESKMLYEENMKKFSNYEIYNKAMSYDKNKNLLAEDDISTGGGILISSDNMITNRKITNVDTITLDDFINDKDIDTIDILKIDCEGEEHDIFENLSIESAKKIRLIVGEYHNGYGDILPLLKEKFSHLKFKNLSKNNKIGMFLGFEKEIFDKIFPDNNLEYKTPLGNILTISYIDGCKVEIIGKEKANYDVEFIDMSTGISIYSTQITTNNWTMPLKKYLVNWKIVVRENDNLFLIHETNFYGKKVKIIFSSKSLGDTIAWIPYVEQFRQKFSGDVVVSTFWNDILKESYPMLEYEEPSNFNDNYYAIFKIGAFDNDYNRNKNNWRIIPLQQVASDILGMDFLEIKPKIKPKNTSTINIKEKYVAISEFSTFKGKHWNYPNGWQNLVNWLVSQGYKVVSVSKEKTHLENVVKLNDRPIDETISNISGAEFFIGVASGLSWLAHALDIPVVIISGFTLPISEMKDCERIINNDVCVGCYNDLSHIFDRKNFNWCPRNKFFQCSNSITTEDVKKVIRKMLYRDKVYDIVYLLPHCSTGGMPQYTLQLLQKNVDKKVAVIEYQNISNIYTVQKKKIKEMCNFFTLGKNKKEELLNLLDMLKPKVLHIQEFSERFIPKSIADEIYTDDRNYQIVETTHTCDVIKKEYLPDKFSFVSSYQEDLYKNLDVPCVINEYELTAKERPNRETALSKLNLDVTKKHILNVGLFAPWKNQAEIFQIAEEFPDYVFHFVGNLAENFSNYWKPLMAEKPPNCIIWGEQDNIDSFYCCMDMFLFTSKKECNPICIKEAISWNMKVVIYDLAVYKEKYDSVHYVKGIEEIKKLLQIL